MVTRSGGILGILEATTGYQTLYQPGSGVLASGLLSICNRSTSTRTVQFATIQSTSTDPTPTTFQIYNRTLQAAGNAAGLDVLQFSGIVLNGTNSDQAVIQASGADVDCILYGVTEAST